MLRDESVYVNSQDCLGKLATSAYRVEQDGYVRVYLASESDAPAYFDNLSVSHQQAMIVQEHHFDPFGLHLVGIEKEGSYPYQYNGLSEQQADPTGKGYAYETDWRGYDPQLGRFKGIDALAHEMPGINPYQYAFNNPLNFNDPSGLIVLPVLTVAAKRIVASTASQVFGQAVMHSAVQLTAGAAIQALGGGASGCCPGPCCPEQGAQQAQTSRQTPGQQGVAREARGVNPLTLPVAEQVVERVVGQAVGQGAAWLVRGASTFVAAMLYPHPAGAGSAFSNHLVGEQLQRFNELEAIRTTGSRSLTPSEVEELDILTQLKYPHGRPSRVPLSNSNGGNIITNVDDFIASQITRMYQKLGGKIGKGELPFDRGKAGVDKAIESVRTTLLNPTHSTGIIPKSAVRGDYDLIHIYSSKSGNTVSLRVLGGGKYEFDTLIPGRSSKF